MDSNERPRALPDRILAILRQEELWVDPPADLEDRTLAALRAERDNRSTSTVDELAVARERRSRRQRWAAMLVAGAAAVAFGAVATVAITGNNKPESTLVILAGTELEPNAAGRANIVPMDSGFEIELDISGLPPAPAGSYYQGWLRNEDGDAVTIGTFHGREGTDDIILWSGVDIADYSALTVTIQQEGAGAESSGRVVLRGETPAG
ncbi:MAG TPA: anti-sigma factor [Jiangellaceae bacterium]|nr:anti-sigma factor [Jiangellaceae bacterium]